MTHKEILSCRILENVETKRRFITKSLEKNSYNIPCEFASVNILTTGEKWLFQGTTFFCQFSNFSFLRFTFVKLK